MDAGQVHWVEFPGGAGRAQAGRRPAIVVQGKKANSSLPTVLLIPLTTQQDALRFPGTVLVETDASNGLHQMSVALVFQLTAVDQRFLGKQLGSVAATVLDNIWSALDEIAERKQP
ncbi:MAG TPA: type II toxin-antitoxin system PemK/MazF family toxin [Gemmataceae bacterium]|nr:type II toxin-antitoxin system PemK/MazF family toxin [Gemmataceae bacterium]